MGWDYSRSLDRAKRKYDETQGLTVVPLVRETDFSNISLKDPRLVRGAHFYVHVPNFKNLLDENGDEAMVTRTHIWAREATRVVEGDFDAVKIHFQGPRLHAISYRPIGNDQDIVVRAVLAATGVRASTRIFNEALDLADEEQWATCGGIDFGDSIGTNIGVGGDRELLFLGSPANEAAHLIATGMRISEEIFNILPDDLSEHVTEITDDSWRFSLTNAELETLSAKYGHSWTAEGSRKRIEADYERYPDGTAKVVDASSTIDKSKLGISNTKRLDAVSFFADVDGFTGYVEACEQDNDLVEAVRAWHVLRSEMRNTAVVDFDALRIQYQGDRLQGIVYLPIDDQDAFALKAVRIAAALNSVVADVLPSVIGGASLPLAIGMAIGTTLVSKLGEHGDRDVVTLATATAAAANIQERLSGTEIGITKEIRDLLPDWLAHLFVWRSTAQAYVTESLTLDELERLEAAESADLAKSLLNAAATAGAVVAGVALVKHRKESKQPPLRPYCP